MKKYDLVSALAEETAGKVAASEENWRDYLDTASRLYRYRFQDQLLIHAQFSALLLALFLPFNFSGPVAVIKYHFPDLCHFPFLYPIPVVFVDDLVRKGYHIILSPHVTVQTGSNSQNQ